MIEDEIKAGRYRPNADQVQAWLKICDVWPVHPPAGQLNIYVSLPGIAASGSEYLFPSVQGI